MENISPELNYGDVLRCLDDRKTK